MNFKLIRYDYLQSGIFGVFLADGFKLETLEHAYADGPNFTPKVPIGTYTCRRGNHRLIGMSSDFETFQIIGVPEHTNILFHVGNINKDSEGCVLLGTAREGGEILNSKIAFNDFMTFVSGIEEFTLEVENAY